MSRQLLNISEERDSASSLGNLCQCSGSLPVKIVFDDVQREPSVFQFVPIASGPVTAHRGKEPGSVFFAPSLQVFVQIKKIPPEPSLPQAEQSQLSQPLLTEEMLQSLNHLHGPSLDSLQYVHVS